MAYPSLRAFLERLEAEGELVRIRERISPHLEITEIVDRVVKSGGPALLFENTGTEFPLAINLFGSYRRMCLALGVESLDQIHDELMDLLSFTPPGTLLDKLRLVPKYGRLARYLPRIVTRGPCQEVTMEPPDLLQLPVMTCWPEDGGPFLTLPIIHTQDPETGVRNVGLYRMQVYDGRTTGMHWHRHKVSARHFRRYQERNMRMPVAVALGGDPVYTYCATAPLPDGIDEYILAGFLRRKPVELVRCRTIPAYVPADADIVIEGYVDPQEPFRLEGPFGDHTGYYSLPDYYPVFHVTCITHRRGAIYPSTIVGIPPQEDAYLGKATERIFLAPIRKTLLPEMLDMNLPLEGVFHNLAIVKVQKEYPGHAHRVMHTVLGAGQMMFTKLLVITDQGADIQNLAEFIPYAVERFDPARDAIFSEGPMDVLDHACSRPAFGGKLAIDVTTKTEEELSGYAGPLDAADVRGQPAPITLSELQARLPEVRDLNFCIPSHRPFMAFVAIEKRRPGHAQAVAEALLAMPEFERTRLLVILEDDVDVQDVSEAVWRFTNNIDPKRDGWIVPARGPGLPSRMVFDATRKWPEEGFTRPWPNILTMTPEVIARIDVLWPRLGLGPLIPSPSRKHLAKVRHRGAVVEP
ncbi:MAG: menaquinone biosynthesis decarboxylase [Bacteroidota bacterium]|nr:menaquinone biosynthesis decarboxylase [Rhodothermia bacterium]MDW8285781.1 menaquinone biosynthesis decarboxylase [Bacteroidota bacterium]